MVALIDTHAHLDDGQFTPDLATVLLRARAEGVVRVMAVGITAASSAACVTLAEREPDVSATVGIHPNEVLSAAPNDWDRVVELANHPRVVGIGETGLDRHWDKTPFATQLEWFARHLELARRRDLAVVIHCRDAEEEVIAQLREQFDRHGPIRGVMHSYTGTWAGAERCLAMGLHLSFAGMLTYKNAENVRAVAARVPLDRLLVETDCPYLAPVPYRGKRNEPAHVVHTARRLAELRGLDLEALATITTGNARRLFRLPPG